MEGSFSLVSALPAATAYAPSEDKIDLIFRQYFWYIEATANNNIHSSAPLFEETSNMSTNIKMN